MKRPIASKFRFGIRHLILLVTMCALGLAITKLLLKLPPKTTVWPPGDYPTWQVPGQDHWRYLDGDWLESSSQPKNY